MRGFTIIEVLISFAILIIVFAGIFAVLNVGGQSWNAGSGSLDLQQQARQAMDGITKELRQSNVNNITIAPDRTAINFTIPMNITTNPITYSSNIGYYLNEDNQVIREHPVDTTRVLANNITNLSFCCEGGDSCFDYQNSTIVQIQLEASKSVRQRALTPFNLTEQVRLRNE